MNGIDKITQKIADDASADIARINAETDAELAAIEAKLAADIDAMKKTALARGAQRADERKERLHSAALMEAKKLELGAKQEMISAAFTRATEQLCALDDAKYVELLANLVVKASSTGNEAVIFSAKDRSRIGKQVVIAANAQLLSGAINPTENKSKVAAAIGVIGDVAAAKLTGKANLTLSEQTRDIMGGFILSDGDVEVNCAFETLVRLQREALEIQVADMLFA